MFLLVASALGAAIVGWPCQRLNWGWRNVWSTCSVNSFAPVTGQPAEVPQQVPNFWRTSPFVHPTNAIHPSGWYQPQATSVPQYFCDSAKNTGSGITNSLRNRCRRAVDAYGSLVRLCAAPAAPQFRSANAVSPDHIPAAGHSPHVSNVAGLTVNAQLCLLPAGANTPAQLNTPSNTCPGLLGWFTVVFNACGFTNAPALTPANLPQTPGGINQYFPIHPNQNTGSVTSGTAGIVVVAPAAGKVGFFCGSTGGTPDAWNQSGATFRTGRCRKALDQFGRTAQRCHQSTSALTGPAQAGGYSDPLRLLAIGGPQTATPNGFNLFAPGCNN